MSIQYHRWPFMPVAALTPEQADIWWRDCFVPLPAMPTWQSAAPAVAVVGGAGSGKSTAVAWMRRALDPNALVIAYDTENWARLTQAGIARSGNTLLAQIFAQVSLELIRRLDEQPDRAAALTHNPFAAEFLTWLLDAHLERRTFLRFRHRLAQSLALPDLLPEKADLQLAYNGATLTELLETTQELGFSRVMLFLDLNEQWAEANLADLALLFQVIPLLEQQGLLVRAALPESSLEKGNLALRAAGRLQLARLYFDEAACCQIVQRCLRVATDGRFDSLEMLADTAVLQQARAEIEKLYGGQALAGWLHWAETLLAIYDGAPSQDVREAVYHYYSRHVPLRLATDRQGAWRGPQFVPLEQRPFELLNVLFQLKGRPSPEELIYVAGNSQQNLNTLASRLRKALEPIPEKSVYIQNTRASGYWLECFLPQEH